MGTAAVARGGVEIQYRATGIEAVKRGAREVANTSDQVSSKFGSGARQIAGAAEMIARQGKVTGESLKQIAAQAGEMAFMFGPQGAIAGAIAVTGVAIFSFFQRTRQEIEETRKKAQQEIDQLTNSGDYRGLQIKLRDLENGTPAGGYEDGIKGRQQRIGAMRSSLAATPWWESARRRELTSKIAAANAELEPLIEQRTRLMNLLLNPPVQPREIRGLPAVVSTALAPGAKPKGGTKEEMSLFDIMGGAGATKALPLSNLGQSASKGFTLGLAFTPADVDKALGKDTLGEKFKNGIDSMFMDWGKHIEQSAAGSLGGAIAAGFQAAFSGEGIVGGIKAFGRTILSSLGGLFMQMGETYLMYGGIMQGLAALLPNPFTAGAAGLAIGAALMALGGALQGVAGGGGGRGGGGFGGGIGATAASAQVIDRGYINPGNPFSAANLQPRQPVNVTVIGADDRRAQRQIVDLISNAQANNIKARG